MSEFKHTQETDGKILLLSFAGLIDEDASFPAVDASKFEKLIIDLNDVKAINSVGIREWLDWIRPLANKLQIVLKRCPKAMVFQFNMVEGFLPAKAQVTSFYVPFFCEKCDREDSFLFNVGQEVKVLSGQVKIEHDAKKAAGCNNPACELEMDVTESKYFQFLKRA